MWPSLPIEATTTKPRSTARFASLEAMSSPSVGSVLESDMLITSIPSNPGGPPQARARLWMHQSSASASPVPVPASLSTLTSTKRAPGAIPTA